jgi:hypothetical protein
MCGYRCRRTLVAGRRRLRGTTMIDWDSDDWGNGVTHAANGSWVTDKHGEDDAELDRGVHHQRQVPSSFATATFTTVASRTGWILIEHPAQTMRRSVSPRSLAWVGRPLPPLRRATRSPRHARTRYTLPRPCPDGRPGRDDRFGAGQHDPARGGVRVRAVAAEGALRGRLTSERIATFSVRRGVGADHWSSRTLGGLGQAHRLP